MTITTSYLVCTTPRSGSNFLCEVLTSTGVAGNVQEYFWNLQHWYETWRVSDFGEYLDRMLEEGQSPNGVFGMKLMSWHVHEFAPKIAAQRGWPDEPAPGIMERMFPNLHYVWLTRRNKVRQAVSLHRAHQTKIWRSNDAEKVGPSAAAFDDELIDLMVDAMVLGEAFWADYFSSAGIRPLTVVYEDFIQDPRQGVAEILEYLQVPAPPNLSFPEWTHRRQADAVSDEWVQRYQELKERELQRLP